MKIKLSHTLVTSACFIAVSSQATALTSLQVSSPGKVELVGSISTVIDAGEAENFPDAAVVFGSTFASFQMVLADGSGTRFADLRLTPVSSKGNLDTESGTQSGLMIAQTVNSQGLEDSGTISILTDFASPNGSGISSITIRLDWFEPDTNIPLQVATQVTTFDYDFSQYLAVADSAYVDEQHGSNLTLTSADGLSMWASGNTDSTFNNPNNAVIFDTTPASSMLIELGKDGHFNSLFMFEFRTNSENLVPEPSSSLLAMIGLAGLSLRRRRNA